MTDDLILDRYRLQRLIARGGTAEVWRAQDEQLERAVAIKRLHPHLVPDAAARARLVAEARAAARLSHPGIVSVYDIDAANESPAIVMELVDGESLADRLERAGPLAAADVARIGAELADALYHAHERGVIHRDVKPGNVLLARDGRARLVDFGIARVLADASRRLTVTGTVIGTLGAMSPEQLLDDDVTPRTDLYGLGVVLHEAATARRPYDATSPLRLVEKQRAGPPVMAGVDAELRRVIAACLAFTPGDRPLHGRAVAEQLRAWLADGSIEEERAAETVIVPVASDAAPVGVPTGGSSQPPWLALSAALVVLLLIGMLAWGALGRGPAAVASPTAVASGSPAASPVIGPPVTADPPQAAPPASFAERWQAELARKYAEDCGVTMDPGLIAGLDKKAAEDAVKAVTEDCKRDRDDG